MENTTVLKNRQVFKTKERVRDLAEVFTSEREVNAMLDLVGLPSENIESTFMEPTCGNGNFLEGILKRKLNTVRLKYRKQNDVEFYMVKAVASIYGIDISEDNVLEARERMFYLATDFFSNTFNTRKATDGFWESLRWVLDANIVHGDTLNKLDDVVLVEYTTPKNYHFKRIEFRYGDQLKSTKEIETLFEEIVPLKTYKICMYQNLCS